jgi:hypothetical protein
MSVTLLSAEAVYKKKSELLFQKIGKRRVDIVKYKIPLLNNDSPCSKFEIEIGLDIVYNNNYENPKIIELVPHAIEPRLITTIYSNNIGLPYLEKRKYIEGEGIKIKMKFDEVVPGSVIKLYGEDINGKYVDINVPFALLYNVYITRDSYDDFKYVLPRTLEGSHRVRIYKNGRVDISVL